MAVERMRGAPPANRSAEMPQLLLERIALSILLLLSFRACLKCGGSKAPENIIFDRFVAQTRYVADRLIHPPIAKSAILQVIPSQAALPRKRGDAPPLEHCASRGARGGRTRPTCRRGPRRRQRSWRQRRWRYMYMVTWGWRGRRDAKNGRILKVFGVRS